MQAALVGGKTEAKRGDGRRQRMGSEYDREGLQPAPASTPGSRYAIRVEGHLDAHWSEWLEGMTLTHEEGGLTRLEGPLVDQAALHGLLNKLWDLRLPIVMVERLGAEDTASQSSPEPPESTA
jgi:hypothetical protein